MSFEILETETNGTIIKVVGVGGAGGNAVEHMIRRGVQGVEFVCANTDHQALARSSSQNILQLGKTGLGAGSRPDAGRAAAEAGQPVVFTQGCNAVVPTRPQALRRCLTNLVDNAVRHGGDGSQRLPAIAGPQQLQGKAWRRHQHRPGNGFRPPRGHCHQPQPRGAGDARAEPPAHPAPVRKRVGCEACRGDGQPAGSPGVAVT